MDFPENGRRFQFMQARLETGVEDRASHASGCDPGFVGALLIGKTLKFVEDPRRRTDQNRKNSDWFPKACNPRRKEGANIGFTKARQPNETERFGKKLEIRTIAPWVITQTTESFDFEW